MEDESPKFYQGETLKAIKVSQKGGNSPSACLD
jgi:hypothetical protein